MKKKSMGTVKVQPKGTAPAPRAQTVKVSRPKVPRVSVEVTKPVKDLVDKRVKSHRTYWDTEETRKLLRGEKTTVNVPKPTAKMMKKNYQKARWTTNDPISRWLTGNTINVQEGNTKLLTKAGKAARLLIRKAH